MNDATTGVLHTCETCGVWFHTQLELRRHCAWAHTMESGRGYANLDTSLFSHRSFFDREPAPILSVRDRL